MDVVMVMALTTDVVMEDLAPMEDSDGVSMALGEDADPVVDMLLDVDMADGAKSF